MRLLMLATASIAAALALAAYGSGQDPERRENGDLTLEQARAFADFPLYYAGDRVDSFPLVVVLRRNDTANYVSFVYGECRPASYDAGCAPPAEIQVWPGAIRNLGSYDASLPGSPVPERTSIRGVPAAFLDDGTRLEIYTGGSTVVVFSGSRARVLEIARALRCMNAEAPSEGALMC